MEDVYIRGARVETPPSMLARDAAWLVNRAGVMGGPTEVGTMAPAVTVLTLGEGLAVFDIVVVGTAP